MEDACKRLEGTHDFRNLCKMDVGNAVTNYVRRINKVAVRAITNRLEFLYLHLIVYIL